ncbi:4137_t:CDS:2, partial [Gigaspora margarita]
DESLSENTTNTGPNSDHSNKNSDTDHSNIGILIKHLILKYEEILVGFGNIFAGDIHQENGKHMEIALITKPTKVINTTTQSTITEMFHHAAEQNLHQKEFIDRALVLNYYWDAPLDHSLIAMLLDSRCKFMTKLDNWERDKAISLLREEYNSICIKNENITNLPNNEPNENQMQLFSIMFGPDITPVKNEIDEYFKINQVPATTNPLNW